MVRSLFDRAPFAFAQGRADFLLAAAVTRTCEIPGITQAGIPGQIPLTPVLDAEFLCTGRVYSLDDPAKTASGIPTPGLLTRAVHELHPFASLSVLDLGLEHAPRYCPTVSFGFTPTPSIDKPESFDAEETFEAGLDFGRRYRLSGDFAVVGESTPGGTTTAQAAVGALGYDTAGHFASSFRHAPAALKADTVRRALATVPPGAGTFARLGQTADRTLLFTAGFMLTASRRFPVVLGGGTQMAAALLIADTLARQLRIAFDPRRLTLCTTRWIADDGASDIAALLRQLSFDVRACYADFLYTDATVPVLRRYDEGEAKEGVGAGAALAYGLGNGLSPAQITARVERLMGVA